jgi:hypothetical protein
MGRGDAQAARVLGGGSGGADCERGEDGDPDFAREHSQTVSGEATIQEQNEIRREGCHNEYALAAVAAIALRLEYIHGLRNFPKTRFHPTVHERHRWLSGRITFCVKA